VFEKLDIRRERHTKFISSNIRITIMKSSQILCRMF